MHNTITYSISMVRYKFYKCLILLLIFILLCWHYAYAFNDSLCSKLCWHNRRVPIRTWLEQNQTPFLSPGNKTFSVKSDVCMIKRHSFCYSHQWLQNIHSSELLNFYFTIHYNTISICI